MARITVEDCLEQIPNRFKLLMVASRRAHQLASGSANPTVEWENDKATVVALREIATGAVNEETNFKAVEARPEELAAVEEVTEEEIVVAEAGTEALEEKAEEASETTLNASATAGDEAPSEASAAPESETVTTAEAESSSPPPTSDPDA